MEINKLINLLDTVEDALLYSLETTSCEIGKEKSNQALSLICEVRTSIPSDDDVRLIELTCNELPDAIDFNIREYEKSLSRLNTINAHIEESISILEEVERIAQEYQVQLPEMNQETLTGQYQDIQNQPVASVQSPVDSHQGANLPVIDNSQQRPDLIDYDDFTVSPVSPINYRHDEKVEKLPSLSIAIDKRLLYKGYLQALKHLGRDIEPKTIYDSSIFIDNFAFHINNQFSPSMSVESAIKAFASSGDALKIRGHKKVVDSIIWEIPGSYIKSCVERSGFSMESDTIDRLSRHTSKIFDFSMKASELLKESIVTLDNDSIMDLLADFE